MSGRDLFEQVLTLSASERALALEAAPEPFRSEARRLLAALETAPGFLAAPLGGRRVGPDDEVGPYRILGELGSGGMSTVFAARRTDGLHPREVALKLLRYPGPLAAFDSRMRMEIALLARLEHPYIIRLLDCGLDERHGFFLVTELAAGAVDLMAFARPLSREARLRLFSQVCEAVAHAHDNFIIHRDLKPGNILVLPDGTPKLLDFGISTLVREEPVEDGTATQHVRLSVGYAAPEQIRQDPARRTTTDLFALGVILYELLAGKRPFERATPHDTLQAVLEAEPPRLTPGVPADLEAIVFQALRKEPAERYRSADSLRADVERYLNGLPVQAAGARFTYRAAKFLRRNRWPLVAGLALLAVAFAGAWSTVQQYRTAESRLEKAIGLSGALLVALTPEVRTPAETIQAYENGVRQLQQLVRETGHQQAKQSLVHHLEGLAARLGHPTFLGHPDLAKAEALLGEAESLARELYQTEANDENAALLAMTTFNRAGILVDLGRAEEAIARVQAILPLNQHAASPARRRMHGHTLARLAEFLTSANRRQEAGQARREVLDLTRQLVQEAPRDASYAAYRVDLAEALAAYGTWQLEAGEPRAAIALLRESLKVNDELRASDGRPHLELQRLNFRLALSAALSKAEQKREAQQLAAACVAEARRFVRAENSARYRRVLARSLGWSARLAGPGTPGAWDEARECLRILREEMAADPAEVQLRAQAARLEQRLAQAGFRL